MVDEESGVTSRDGYRIYIRIEHPVEEGKLSSSSTVFDGPPSPLGKAKNVFGILAKSC